jgi:hypothetical protein
MQPHIKGGPKSIDGKPFECDIELWNIDPMTDLDQYLLRLCSTKVRTSKKAATIHVLFAMRLRNKDSSLEENIEKHIVKIHLRYSVSSGDCYAEYEDMACTSAQREMMEKGRIDIKKNSFDWVADKDTPLPAHGVSRSVYGENKIPCRIFRAVQEVLNAVDITVEHNQDIANQPDDVAACNIAALFMSLFPILMLNDQFFQVIQCFKIHKDLVVGLGSSKRENTQVKLLILQLFDIYLFKTYGHNLYIQAKKFCEVNEMTNDDPLRNAVCNYCNQSDNPDKRYDCENAQCSVAFHVDYCHENANKPGYHLEDGDDEWFCSQQCQITHQRTRT